MSSRKRKGKVASATKSPKQVSSLEGMPNANKHRGTTSSMDTVSIQPRAPRQGPYDTEEVELTLLEEDERRQAAFGVSDGDSVRAGRPKQKRPMSTKDKRSMGLLCTLCEFLSCYRKNAANLR